MNIRNLCLLTLGLLAIGTVPVAAQEKLGDFVTQYGYDWVLGKWAATDNEGQRVEVNYKWGLDKHIVLMDFRMGDFTFHGMTMLAASSEEVVLAGADNQGGIWKGTWGDNYGDAVLKAEGVQADGEIQKVEIVHRNLDAKTIKISIYGLDSWGYRDAEPWSTLTCKRQSRKK